MPSSSGLTTVEILAVFEAEVVAHKGRVTDTFHDAHRLFTRSVLSHVDLVRLGDKVQGGVALKATDEEVWLYPYLFRLVCRNGAIVAQTIESRYLADLHLQGPESARESIREGVAACCAREVFSETVRGMRAACHAEVDLALTLLQQLSGSLSTGLRSRIMDRFFQGGDRSRFGLINAVTAVARDTEDPSSKWDLEELGGALIMGYPPKQPTAGGRVAIAC